jgi:hypothetical protein
MQDHLNGVYNDIKVTTLRVGDSHTITEGPFSGVSGKVVETDNTKVKLELASLGMRLPLKNRRLKSLTFLIFNEKYTLPNWDRCGGAVKKTKDSKG